MKKYRILIVEDEAIIAMEIESNLQNLGYEVTSVVNSGDKAIQKAEADKPDLIIMDIRIQGDKDGIETAEVIRNKFGIPVIFSTAYLDQERIERAKITMPFGYVLKPIQERDLKVTLEMAFYVAEVEAQKQMSEVTNQSILNAMPDMMFQLSSNGIHLDFYAPKSEETYVDAIHIIGKSLFELLPNETAQIYTINIKKTLDERTIQVFEYSLEYGKNDIRFFEARMVPLRNDSVLTLVRNITTWRHMEKSLSEREIMYRTLFEDSIDGYVLADSDTGIISDCNQAFTELVGRTKDELIGKHQRILHPPKDHDGDFSSTFRKHVGEESGEILDAQIITKTGDIKDVNIRARVFEVNSQKIMHAIFRLKE